MKGRLCLLKISFKSGKVVWRLFTGLLTKQPASISCFHGNLEDVGQLVETLSGMQEPGRGPFLSVGRVAAQEGSGRRTDGDRWKAQRNRLPGCWLLASAGTEFMNTPEHSAFQGREVMSLKGKCLTRIAPSHVCKAVHSRTRRKQWNFEFNVCLTSLKYLLFVCAPWNS